MTKTILVVDNEADILTSVKDLIEALGHNVKIVDNGKEALEILKKEKFNLVILDILMVGMRGTQVLEKIRHNPKTKNQKVIFFSVSKMTDYDKKIVDTLNPLAFLSKPIDIEEFKKTIDTVLNS